MAVFGRSLHQKSSINRKHTLGELILQYLAQVDITECYSGV